MRLHSVPLITHEQRSVLSDPIRGRSLSQLMHLVGNDLPLLSLLYTHLAVAL